MYASALFESQASFDDRVTDAPHHVLAHSLAPQGYTLVLAADCLWLVDSQRHLLSTLVAQLAHTSKARALIFAGFHTTAWPVRAFVERAKAAGLEADWEAQHEGRWLLGPTVGDEEFGEIGRAHV